MINYPTTFEQDEELLKQSLTQNDRNCIIFRMGEKEILDFYIKTSEYILELM